MRKITFTLTLLIIASMANLQAKNIDSLQKVLDTTSNDCLKAELYTNIAAELIQYNQPKTREISYADAGKAVDFVLKAIHYNSRNDDTLAIRNNFDCLASAYSIQKKYTQAKWFLLQSNNISRYRKDAPAIINSLMQLASVKIAIKDYKMAERDFSEAIAITKNRKDINREIQIEECLATLYGNTGRVKAANLLEKHCTFLANKQQLTIVEQAKAKLFKQQKVYAMLKTKAKTKKPVVLMEANADLTLQSGDINNKIETQVATLNLNVNNK